MTTLPIAAAVFYGSRMEGIYEVPPKHRDSPRSTGSSAIKAKELNHSK